MIGLRDSATVYGEDAGTGAYTTVVQAALACRLAHVNVNPGQTGAERSELAALRRLLWDPSYVMPETAQIEVSGIRWGPVAGTFAAMRGPSGQVSYRACDVVRQS